MRTTELSRPPRSYWLELLLRSHFGPRSRNSISPSRDGEASNAYAKALRQVDVLNRQDMKDVTQMAGLRNDAAHGIHETLSRKGASLMEQQANLFLARLDQAVQQSN